MGRGDSYEVLLELHEAFNRVLQGIDVFAERKAGVTLTNGRVFLAVKLGNLW